MELRTIPAILLLAAIGTVTLGAMLVFELPETQYDALAATQNLGASGTIVWTDPEGTDRSFDPGITESEFRDSMLSGTMRRGTVFVPAPAEFITPENPHIIDAAEEILLTCGEDDFSKALAGLRFVQGAVIYRSDAELYGQEEFWAYPAETLYLRAGDCEDSAVLLASIYLAMGLDAVLLDFPGHMAAGVRLDSPRGLTYSLDGSAYCYCEASGYLSDIGECQAGCPTDEVRIWRPGSFGDLNDAINGFLCGYRLLIQRIFGSETTQGLIS